jgi:hypothetical protein
MLTDYGLLVSLLVAAAFSTDCFAGAIAISTTPTIANTTTPTSSRRSITFRHSCAAVTPACARFAHPAKAIRLRFAAGFTHRQQQEDSEGDIDAHDHRHRRLSREEHRQRINARAKEQSHHQHDLQRPVSNRADLLWKRFCSTPSGAGFDGLNPECASRTCGPCPQVLDLL